MSSPAAASKSESIQLADGRTLCFARYGAPGGRPVIYLHGAGLSRLDGEHYDAFAREAGVELIATDRPGCGGSSPDPRRDLPSYSYVSYADDLRELADALNLQRFVVAGMSNGGAYALAAASALPDRITAAIAINSTTPIWDRAAWRASPLLTCLSYALIRFAPFLALMGSKRFAASGDGIAHRAARESLRQQGSGYLRQELRVIRNWGFDHTSVNQPVEIFSGEQDGGHGYAPIWAKRLPNARLHVIPGNHGDYVVPESAKRIVAAMAAAAQGCASAVPPGLPAVAGAGCAGAAAP